MNKIFLLLLVLTATFSNSQTYVLPNDIIQDFVSTPTNQISNSDAVVSAKIGEDNLYEFTIEYGGEHKAFKLKPLTFPNFQSKFKSNFSELLATINDNSGSNTKLAINAPINTKADNKIALLFTQIVTYFNAEEERPQVATLYLKNNINVYYDFNLSTKEKKEGKTTKDVKIEIDQPTEGAKFNSIGILENPKVEISFYAGFIEKIQVNAIINDQKVSFNNKFSIGISSTKNIRQLSNNRLYTNEQFAEDFFSIKDESTASDQVNSLNGRQSLFINVADVIRYVKKVDVNANDISPVPQLVLLDEDQQESKLYKEESSKLFEAVVYSDFFGIFDEESPNGIIQTEITKRFNIETQRIDMRKKWLGILFPPLCLSEGVGFLQFFDAHFKYSKIEKNNKFLLPEVYETFDDNGNLIYTENYYSNIALFQHRNFSIGGTLNIMTLENQNAKLNMYLNTGFSFGRSGIKETEDQENGEYINNLEIPIEFKFHLLPEKRVSFEFGSKLSWFELLSSDVTIKSIEDKELVNRNRWLNSFNVDVNVDVSGTGKLFLRYKLIHELDNININFSQLQFGYSFYLLQKNGVKKNPS